MLYPWVTLRFRERSSVEVSVGKGFLPSPSSQAHSCTPGNTARSRRSSKMQTLCLAIRQTSHGDQIPSGSITNKYIILYQCC